MSRHYSESIDGNCIEMAYTGLFIISQHLHLHSSIRIKHCVTLSPSRQGWRRRIGFHWLNPFSDSDFYWKQSNLRKGTERQKHKLKTKSIFTWLTACLLDQMNTVVISILAAICANEKPWLFRIDHFKHTFFCLYFAQPGSSIWGGVVWIEIGLQYDSMKPNHTKKVEK